MNVESAVSGADPAVQPILLRERQHNVEVVTLNCSKKRNALSDAMISALVEAFEEISRDSTVQVVVLASTGPLFCAGHDLKEMAARRADADGGRVYFGQLMTSCSKMMQAIVCLPQPVIAAVQGVATAAGCQLVASCDLAVAASDARFATPGVDIGLFCSTPMVALSRNVSRKHAMEMLLTGEMISADDAVRIGLINRVVPSGSELEQALFLARRIAAKSPKALKIGKVAFYRQAEMSLSEAYSYTSEIMVENMLNGDAVEGICAFTEKRQPKWPLD